MARTPDGAGAREKMVTARMSERDKAMLDFGRTARGDRTNSDYLRRLVREDNKRIEKSAAAAGRRPKGNG